MATCEMCNQELPDESPFTAAEVQAAVVQTFGEEFHRFYNSYNMARGLSSVILRNQLTVATEVDRNSNIGYEDYESHPVHVVFSLYNLVGDAQFFKMSGYESSYNGTEWDGQLKEVKAIPKTIIVYE